MDYETGFKFNWTAKEKALQELEFERLARQHDYELKELGVELI